MQVTLKSGDNLWSEEGTHICDERGMAIVVTEDTTVDIADEAYANAWQVIQSWRETRGVSYPDSEPLPVVEPVVEPVVIEPVVDPTPEVVPKVVSELTPAEGEDNV